MNAPSPFINVLKMCPIIKIITPRGNPNQGISFITRKVIKFTAKAIPLVPMAKAINLAYENKSPMNPLNPKIESKEYTGPPERKLKNSCIKTAIAINIKPGMVNFRIIEKIPNKNRIHTP